MKLDSSLEIKRISKFIQTTFKNQGFKKAVIAISGGIDSVLALALTIKAIGRENIHTLQLPYKRQLIELSSLAINHFKIPFNQRLHIKLNREVDKLSVKLNAKKDQLRLGNIMARIRMTCLFDQAKKLNALVIGTENKSEHLLGYFTRFGDQASDIEPLIHLYKTQVIKLAQHLKLPISIINQPPSANLWPNQTDEQELGFSYSKADPILQLLIDKKLSPQKIISLKYQNDIVKKVVARVKANAFKHQVPYTLL